MSKREDGMTSDNDLSAAVAEGKAIFEMGMETGNHSIVQRIRDMMSPVGNSTGPKCVLKGHKWSLDDPRELQYNSLMPMVFHNLETGEAEVKMPDIEFPKNPTWTCFCTRCGAGSYFDDPPSEVFEIDYWCYSCESIVSGEKIVDHAKGHLSENGRWPVYSRAEVHAPDNLTK